MCPDAKDGAGKRNAVHSLAFLQWLFIVEGLPTVVLGLWINRSLAESPLKADFLKPQEAQWLHQRQTRNKVAHFTHSVPCSPPVC